MNSNPKHPNSMTSTMNDDALYHRIRAHRSAPDVYDPPTFEQMANRIEDLIAENKRLNAVLREHSAELGRILGYDKRS